MKRILVSMIWCALLPFTSARAEVTIAPANRVGNHAEHGVCWFACAETIGRELKIAPLVGLTRLVVETGIGRDKGARPEDIDYWMKKLNLHLTAYEGATVSTLVSWLDKKVPVIVSVKHWEPDQAKKDPTHALILTDITTIKQDFVDGAGQRHRDQIVSFIDPNWPETVCRHTLTWFTKQWVGRAYVFDPTTTIAKTPRQPNDAQPIIMPMPQPSPSTPLSVPRVVLVPPRQPSSNQDIKDGVRRPSDVIERYPGISKEHDYYQEFRRRPK